MLKFLKKLANIVMNEHGFAGAGDPPAGDPPAGDPPAAPEWVATLPEPMRTDPLVTKYKTPEEFQAGIKNMAELVGRKGVILPKADAKPEEVGAFWTALGRPEKPDGYKFTDVKDLHASIKITPESQAMFAQIAHKANLTPAQADAVNSLYLTMASAMVADQEKTRAEAVKNQDAALRAKWQGNYDANLAKVRDVITKAGGPEAIKAFGDLGNNPAVLEVLGKIAGAFSEDSLKLLGGGGGSNRSEGGAQKQIDEINAADKKTHPFWNENDPKHGEWVAKVRNLYVEADKEATAAA